MMDERGGEIEALRQVVGEASEEKTPDLDWDRLEARLMDRARSETASASSAPSPWRWAAALAAAAAVVLVGLGLLRSSEPAPVAVAPPEPAAASVRVFGPDVQGVLDGAKLAVGDTVVSAAREVSVDHPGRARWTLAPNSRAVLTDAGERLTLKLESGAVVSHVVPDEKPETYAVVVHDVRVAVHGTVFRVERSAERALVSVQEGVVAVGPATASRTEGWLLRAGDQGSFTLDAKEGTVQRAPTAQLEPVTVEGTVPRTAHKQPAGSAASLADAPTTAELERGLDGIVGRVTRCFDEHVTAGDVRVMARTRLTARVQPNGSLAALTFDPPLAPAVQACMAGAERSTKFPVSRLGAVVERSVLLGP